MTNSATDGPLLPRHLTEPPRPGHVHHCHPFRMRRLRTSHLAEVTQEVMRQTTLTQAGYTGHHAGQMVVQPEEPWTLTNAYSLANLDLHTSRASF